MTHTLRRLSDHVNKQYLKGVNFYKASNLGGENNIDNAFVSSTHIRDPSTTSIERSSDPMGPRTQPYARYQRLSRSLHV